MSDLTGQRFESQISGSKDERVTARPTGRYLGSVRTWPSAVQDSWVEANRI